MTPPPPHDPAPTASSSRSIFLSSRSAAEGSASPPTQPTPPGPAPTHLTLTAPHAEDLILNLRDYPAWRITLNHAPAPPRLSRPDGLIAIPIPAGPSTVDIHYTQTPDQTASDAITLLALAALLLILRNHRLNLR
jgi:hypothetical protein